MGLRTKLNLLLLVVGALGAALFWFVSAPQLEELASQEVEEKARIMMASAKGVRDYTAEKVAWIFEEKMAKDKKLFYPEAVSAYVAKETFRRMHDILRRRPEFTSYAYKERALNPTVPEETASDEERKSIEYFQNNSSGNPLEQENVQIIRGAKGAELMISAPLKALPSCLRCHDAPEKAPPSMRERYGSEHGFRWKEGEIIGAQIVTVPMKVALDRATEIKKLFLFIYLGVLAMLGSALNVGLELIVTRRVREMSRIAEAVSQNKPGKEREFDRRGSDEIARLAQSFTRMRRSLELNEGPLSSQDRGEIPMTEI